MSNYGWIITADHIDDGQAVGTVGPAGITSEMCNRLKAGEGQKQRLYDDDRELYYEARLIGGDGFEVLDDLGTAVGCSYAQYFENGRWKYL